MFDWVLNKIKNNKKTINKQAIKKLWKLDRGLLHIKFDLATLGRLIKILS